MDLGVYFHVFVPTLAAVGAASIVVIISSFFKGDYVAIIQSLVFSGAMSGAVAFLAQSPQAAQDLQRVFTAFKGMSDQNQLAVAVVIIGFIYFGASLYVTAGGTTNATPTALETPASIDTVVDFIAPSTLPADDKEVFDQMFDRLKNEIVEDLPTLYELPSEAVQWVDRMIQYTVAGGKMNRGLTTMAVRRILAQQAGRSLTNRERVQSAALGWCVEWLQAFFLVADDVMDASLTRRGQPCWFRLPEVKLIAINDSFILETCVFKILKRYFGSEPYYAQLLDIFIEVTRQTEFGQLLDLTSQTQDGKIDLTRFTQQRYASIVKYKTAFYSFYLPVALGMIVSGVTDRRLYDRARDVLMIMGEYFQVQDDYLDCYGAPEVIGKIGTDIQDNKCGWLVVQALKLVTPAQRKILEDNYGRHDDACVAIVKELYEQLGMGKVFAKYEEESYAQIQALLKTEKQLPPAVFGFLLDKIYKRSK